MADEQESDRSEQATPFKLMRARRKGSVARGADLGFLTGLTAFVGYAWITGEGVGRSIAQAVRGALTGASHLADGPNAVFAAIVTIFASALVPLAMMAGTIFLVVLLFEVLQTGPVFSAEPLKPDFSRLSPAKGLKRLFTLRLLIETLKNVLKLALYTSVGYLIIRAALASDIGRITDGYTLMAVMIKVGFRLAAAFIAIAFFFAVIDQLIVRNQFSKQMRMSRRELRREAREREGEPRLKQKRKQMHAEFVKLSQSLKNLRNADVLITNPEHIALALRYDPRTMQAPLIVSVGTNRIAQRLKRLAFVYGIPIVENRTLARELLRKSGLNKTIPDHCYRPVADIYNTLRQRAGQKIA